jgi:membrane-associated phospholipid phosphatase
MYIADIAGVKAKNHWFDQTKYLFISNLISSGTTHFLKNWTKKPRPAGADDSFPSGHTTFAFTNATVLYNEFSQSSDALAYSGYAFATTTGMFRMINNKHWLSDVLVGAGIGIIATELVYYIEPFKNFNPFKDSENMSLIPIYNDTEYSLYFTYKF